MAEVDKSLQPFICILIQDDSEAKTYKLKTETQ